jgi:spore maturation protein CgeB
MSYCFVRVTDNYPQYIKSFYSKNPDIHLRSYTDQYERLINDSFESSSSYIKNFNNIGIEAYGIISNATVLQNTWKIEHGISPEISPRELIIEQLKFYKPDVVWIDDFSLIDKAWKDNLLKEVPSIKLLLGHICAPYNSVIAEKFSLFDVMFTCIPCLKKDLTDLGIKTHLLYHSFDTSILDVVKSNNDFPESGFLFSGSLYAGSGFHKSRIEYIEEMLKAGIEIDLYCNLESRKKVMTKKGMYIILNSLKKLRLEKIIDRIPVLRKNKGYGDVPIKYYSKRLLKNSKLPVFGNDMYKLLAKAKICFNIHGEVADKCAGNIRLFEATGVGTCLVTDWKENITDLFEPGREIVTYRSIGECIEKVKWLLDNPSERKRIAEAGQKKTLSQHSVKIRTERLHEIIKQELSAKSHSE